MMLHPARCHARVGLGACGTGVLKLSGVMRVSAQLYRDVISTSQKSFWEGHGDDLTAVINTRAQMMPEKLLS